MSLSFWAGLAAMGPHALALHSMQRPAPMDATEIYDQRSCINGAYRQQLDNMGDLQYHGMLDLGGQQIRGIIDTGSFELVVFSASCTTCGRAAAYNEAASKSFRPGNVSTVHSYGSGSCMSSDGWEDMHLGCLGVRSQAIWVAKQCEMPALQMASFNSIVGVGPPGQPEYTARSELEQLQQVEDDLRQQGQAIPADLKEAKAKISVMLEDALTKPALLDSYAMKTFSHCLGRAPGSPGFMVWNDQTREEKPGVKKIPVAGNITWGIAIESMAFATPNGLIPFGCKEGCGAVVDSGTSLMAVPTGAYKAAVQVLQANAVASDCSDLSKFPNLVVKVAGHTLTFPPSSYLGVMEGAAMAESAKFLHLGSLHQDPDSIAATGSSMEGKGVPGAKSAAEATRIAAVAAAAKAAAEAAAAAAAAANDASDSASFAAEAARSAAQAAHEAAYAAATAAAVAAGEPMPPAEQPKSSPQRSAQGPVCELLLMDIGEQQTVLGPMMILGMPFFRQFYTTFDLGKGRGDRSIFVSQASEDCQPVTSESPVVNTARMHDAITPRHLDASKIRAPRWLDKLPRGEF
eukprot:CAMPEP_0197891094 /NCGR_PEP_ID=MMETSP1439-20131203/27367_1 /TAXON_ID=66791 /ORGANISM="Gonyaulax spinifera, Strain CCMP409" /LENGTH=573 /DNA_ID=CAMNT_0043511169 /DNA_START=53 /DNA_END=1774 /DNA_ORIENTATION=+